MIRFHCPRCEAQLEVDESFAGQAARCPTCGSNLRVPREGDATPRSDPKPGATTLKFHGKTIEVQPPLEVMAVVSVVIVGLSIVALLVIGLSGLVTLPWTVGMALGSLLALLGAIMAVPAYNTIRRSRGQKRGRHLAIAGLAAGGGLCLIFGIGFLVGFFWDYYRRPSCEQNLKQIYTALRDYAQHHEGAMPRDLETLANNGLLKNRDWLTCPAYHVQIGQPTYILTPDVNLNNPLFPPDLMIVSDGAPYDAHRDGFIRALLLNGTIEKVPLNTWLAYQKKQAQRWNEIQNKIRQGPASAPTPAADAEPPS